MMLSTEEAPTFITNKQMSLACSPTMSFENITKSFDIDSPWDLDTILGQTQSEGDRSEFSELQHGNFN